MKTFCRISLFILSGICIFLLGAYSYSLYTKLFYPNRNQEKHFEEYQAETEADIVAKAEAEEVLEAVESSPAVITCNTVFCVREYDLGKDSVVEGEQPLPAKYLGMDRESFEEAIGELELSPPLEELEKGIVSVEVVAFSDAKVTIQKNYEEPVIKEGFYLVAEDNCVVVYQTDMRTVYLYTDIEMDSLPQNVQDEIMHLKYVDSESKLFDFLESYSS